MSYDVYNSTTIELVCNLHVNKGKCIGMHAQ